MGWIFVAPLGKKGYSSLIFSMTLIRPTILEALEPLDLLNSMKTSSLHRMLQLKKDQNASKTQKTLALTLASTLSAVLGTALIMLMSRLLTKEDLATYQQTFLAYRTFAPFLGLGIASGLYYILARNEQRQRAVIKEAALILLISGSLFACFVLFGGNHLVAKLFSNPKLSNLLFYLIPYSAVLIPATLIPTVFVSQNLISLNAKYNVFTNLAIICIVLVSVAIFRTASAAVASQSLVSIATSLLGLALIFFLILPSDQGKMSLQSSAAILKISVPLGLATMVGTLNMQLDKWVVSALLSPQEFAVFSIGAQELPLVDIITRSISTVILVEMVHAVKRQEFSSALRLFRLMGEKTSLIMLPTMLFFMVSAPALIEVFFTKTYLEAVPVFRVYLLYIPARTVVYGPFLIALGRSNSILIQSTLSLLSNFIFTLIFVIQFGAIGAAVATILSFYLVYMPINFYLISKDTGEKWYRILPFMRYATCTLLSLPAALFCATIESRFSSWHPLLRLSLEAGGFFIITAPLLVVVFKIAVKSHIQMVASKLNFRR